jgi:hypothetical protein
MAFEFYGGEQLFQLAAERLFAPEALSRQLLRDRAPPCTALPARKTASDEPTMRTGSNPSWSPILNGDDSSDQMRRHLGERDLNSVFLGEGEHRAIVRIVQDAGLRHHAESPDLVTIRHWRERRRRTRAYKRSR